MLRHDAVEGLDVLERAAHQHRVGHADAVVGEDAHARGGVGHGTQLGETLALQPDGDGADGLDVAESALSAEPPDLLDDPRGVGDRRGVRHRVHAGEPAAGCGLRAGEHRLCVLAARLAQVGVQVDETGQRHEAVGVDDRDVLVDLQACTDLDDHAVAQQQVGGVAAERSRVAEEVGGHAVPSFEASAGAPPRSR